MATGVLLPDYIFESSWEVCNKVGGIYTVLSTRAKTLQTVLKDRIIFIGPDVFKGDNPYFKEDEALFNDWKAQAQRNASSRDTTQRWSARKSAEQSAE